MEKENHKVKIHRHKKWLRRVLITLAIIVFVPVGLFTIGWLNRDSLIDRLQEWYSEHNTGTLTIEKVNANFLSGFPKVGFTLQDIRMVNTDTISDQITRLNIQEAKVVIGAGKLLRGDINFERISIKNAIITSEVISKRSVGYHEQLKRNKQLSRSNGIQLPKWLTKDGAKIALQNVTFITKDSILNKYFNVHVHEFKGSYKRKDLNINGDANFDITANNLGFNTKKGSFLNGARVRGNPKFNVNLKDNTIDIPEFSLRIDEQNFRLNANFDLSESKDYEFNFQNNTTDFRAVKSLLTDTLAVKLKNYNILNPFKSSIKLSGKFSYGNNPDIEAQFSSINNQIIIADKFHLKNATFNGHLTTDIYTSDKVGKIQKSPKDIKIFFNDIKGELEDIDVDITDSYYQSTPERLNFIEANIRLEGSNQSLATIIETDNFDFKGGRFQLNATISGDIPNPYEFLNNASGNFTLNNTQVFLKKNGLQLPIQTINLALEREISSLKQLVVNLPNGEHLIFRGQLKNISGLLSKTPSIPTTSQIYLDSKTLNINELIAMAKSFIPTSEADRDNRKTLHQTLDAIYSQFHPQFGINIDTLQYNEYVLRDLKSNIGLANSETIVLKNFDFNYLDALTSLTGRVVVHGPNSKLKDAIFMDAEATTSGSINVFKELFDITLFRIDSGEFKFQGSVKGNVKAFDELLNNARGDLALTNTKLYYEPAEMDIAIDSLSLFVDNSNIFLEKFTLEAGEQQPLNLTGSITQFPSFLLDNTTASGAIALKVEAPYLDGDALLSTLKTFNKDKKATDGKVKKTLNRVFKDVYKFNPEIVLDIDSLMYNGLISKDINASIYFENDSILQLNHFDLRYKETTVNIEGNINAHDSQEDLSSGNPFDLDFFVFVKGKSEDLNDYLKTTNFIFESGDFEFVGNYNAQAEELDIMNSKSFGDLRISKTRMDFKSANLQIPIDSLHLEIDDDLATLKTLDIKLPGRSSVLFSGSIDNFSEFINGFSELSLHSSKFVIESPYLDTSDIESFIKNSTLRTSKKDVKKFNLERFKQSLNDINSSFYPSIRISIDTLNHDQMTLKDFKSDLFFDVNGNLQMEDTGFDFYGGFLNLNLGVGMRDRDILPVSINLQATDIDIEEFITRFNYFKDENLKNADSIVGTLNFDMNAIGTVDMEGKVDLSSLNGMFELDMSNLGLYNYKPAMDNSIMMKDERFQNLQFRPIVQTFEIRDGELIIPRTEIQSSAIHLFIEGSVKFNEYVNVWLSLPWSNLKRIDGLTLPEMKSYEDSGSKFYIQLLQDKNSEKARKQKLKAKVRFSNRKLRKLKK